MFARFCINIMAVANVRAELKMSPRALAKLNQALALETGGSLGDLHATPATVVRDLHLVRQSRQEAVRQAAAMVQGPGVRGWDPSRG